MKKVLALTLALLLFLSSCGKELVYLEDIIPDSETIPLDDLLGEPEMAPGWQPIPEYDPTVPRAEALTTHGMDIFQETAHCIIYAYGGHMKYYNKTTGVKHVLCGDPLCDHTECAAACNGAHTMKTLTYVPETGRLYYARCVLPYSARVPMQERRYEIISFDVDQMDFTVKRHYLSKPGDEIRQMGYDDGKLYFTYLSDKNGTAVIQLDELNLTDNSVRHAMEVEGGNVMAYVVKNGIVYRSTGLYILKSYDIASGTETELYVPKDPADEPEYTYYDGHFLCADTHGLKELDLTGKVTREIFRTEDEPHRYQWTIAADGTVYSVGYDPVIFEERDPFTGGVTVTRHLSTGGQVLRWTDGVPEVYADLGNNEEYYYEIQSIMPIGNCVFLYVLRYNHEDGLYRAVYYYIFDGVPYETTRK